MERRIAFTQTQSRQTIDGVVQIARENDINVQPSTTLDYGSVVSWEINPPAI